jgi:hypothetical protein
MTVQPLPETETGLGGRADVVAAANATMIMTEKNLLIFPPLCRRVRISHHAWTLLAGCGKTLQGCHPERSEGSRSAYLLENAQGQILRFAQNDSFEEFFRSLLEL